METIMLKFGNIEFPMGYLILGVENETAFQGISFIVGEKCKFH